MTKILKKNEAVINAKRSQQSQQPLIQVEPIKALVDNKGPSVEWQSEQVSTFAEVRQVG